LLGKIKERKGGILKNQIFSSKKNTFNIIEKKKGMGNEEAY